jgi:hypothetical protein
MSSEAALRRNRLVSQSMLAHRFRGAGGAPDQRADVLPRIIGVAVLRRLAAGVLDLKNTDFGEVAISR